VSDLTKVIVRAVPIKKFRNLPGVPWPDIVVRWEYLWWPIGLLRLVRPTKLDTLTMNYNVQVVPPASWTNQ